MEIAIQEDVDAVGLSSLSGAHMALFPKVIEGLKSQGSRSGPRVRRRDNPRRRRRHTQVPRHGRDLHAGDDDSDDHRVASRSPRRGCVMDPLEYMGKQVFAKYGIPVSDGRICTTPEEAEAAAKEIGGQVVVKAQVQVGGRGQGRRHPARQLTRRSASKHAENILGMDIKGHVVERVWVEARPTSPRSTTRRSCSTAARDVRSPCVRRKAASTSKKWPRRTRKHSSASTSIRSSESSRSTRAT